LKCSKTVILILEFEPNKCNTQLAQIERGSIMIGLENLNINISFILLIIYIKLLDFEGITLIQLNETVLISVTNPDYKSQSQVIGKKFEEEVIPSFGGMRGHN